MEDRLVALKDAARYLGISTTTMRRLVRTGEVRAYRIANRKLMVRLSDLEAYIASRAMNSQ
jgi:excisionase family DNA binding protein